MNRKTRRFKVLTNGVFIYVIIGLLWIILSDSFIHMYIHDQDVAIFIERAKGILFVIVSALIMYFLMRKELIVTRETESQLRTLINNMPDFICFKDGEGRWILANEYARELYGIEHRDYTGKTDAELVNNDNSEEDTSLECIRTDDLAWEKRLKIRVEEEVVRHDGEVRFFDVLKVPIFYKDGSRKGLLVIGRDITDLKKSEEALIKSEKLTIVGELAAGIAHEIRNPLTGLKGFTQLLQEKYDDDQRYYEIMLSELERINEIVEELLILSKPRIDQFAEVNIIKVMNQVKALLDTQAVMSNVEIKASFKLDNEMMVCSEKRLKQVFVNVIKNAIEAMPKGGKVKIELVENGLDKIAFRFIDQGNGISRERIKRLGEPFYTTKEKGTGLGLMVTYKIIESHHGKININSEQGKGTTFEIVLPRTIK